MSASRIARTSKLLALLLCLTQSGALALPVRTDDAIQVSALRHVPTFRQFSQTLEYNFENGKPTKTRKVNMMEWSSTEPKNAYLLCIHAFAFSSREFSDFGMKMSELGFDTSALDVRGFGNGRNEKGYKKVDLAGTVSDAKEILKQMRKNDPDKKIFIVGESMGGAIALKVAADSPDLVDGVICSAPAWQLYKIRKITAKGIADRVFGEPGFAAKAIMEQASKDEKLHQQWYDDDTYRKKISIPEAYSYYRFMKKTPKNVLKIKEMPVLIVQGLGDRLSKPAGAAELFSRIASPRKQLAIVANREHLVLEEGQFTSKLANFIAGWLQEKMSGTAEGDIGQPQVIVVDEDKAPESDKALLQQMIKLAKVK